MWGVKGGVVLFFRGGKTTKGGARVPEASFIKAPGKRKRNLVELVESGVGAWACGGLVGLYCVVTAESAWGSAVGGGEEGGQGVGGRRRILKPNKETRLFSRQLGEKIRGIKC